MVQKDFFCIYLLVCLFVSFFSSDSIVFHLICFSFHSKKKNLHKSIQFCCHLIDVSSSDTTKEKEGLNHLARKFTKIRSNFPCYSFSYFFYLFFFLLRAKCLSLSCYTLIFVVKAICFFRFFQSLLFYLVLKHICITFARQLKNSITN